MSADMEPYEEMTLAFDALREEVTTLKDELRAVRQFRDRERQSFLNLMAYIRGEASYLLNAECVDAYDALAMERVFLSAKHDAILPVVETQS